MVNSSNTSLNKLNAYKECNYQSKRIQLTSPLLHIGAADSELTPFDYVQTDKQIYFPNQDALLAVLSQQNNLKKLKKYINLVKQYLSQRDDFQQKDNRRKILALLRQTFGERWFEAEYQVANTEGNLIFPIFSHKKTDQEIKDLRPMIRNAFGELYIPGTSIKGAIRTAIVFYILKNEAEYNLPTSVRVSEVEQKLRERLKNNISKKEAKRIANSNSLFMNNLFTNFKLSYEARVFGKPYTANTDFMRAIKITDSQPLVNNKDINLPIVAEVISSSFYPNGDNRIAKESATNFVEMVWNLQTEFTLTIDTEMLSQFQHEQGMQLPRKLWTVEGILEICQEFAQAQWEHEQRYWNLIKDNPNDDKLKFNPIRKFYNKDCSYNLRLGWGSGMTGTTIGLHFQESTRERIRNACATKPTNSSESPKSRRTAIIPTQTSQTKKPLGWVKLTPVEAEC